VELATGEADLGLRLLHIKEQDKQRGFFSRKNTIKGGVFIMKSRSLLNGEGRYIRSGRLRFLPIFMVLGFLILSNHASAQNTGMGIVSGKIIDGATGEPLFGANAYLINTNFGTAADLEGNYRIANVPAGTYTLRVTYVGYERKEVTGVSVKAGDVVKLDLALNPVVIQGKEVVVTATAIKNSEAALLSERHKSMAVSDAISAEKIARSASGDAGEAMKKVTGASVVDGRYVVIRGLGERYSSTQLNGAELPSSDPDKKSVQLDMFPSNLLENIVTVKSFTPDKPGNFTGGSVNIGTKNFPEKFTLSFSHSSSFNTQSALNSNFLSYPGGGLDWLGMDDGTRALPDLLESPDAFIPDVGSASFDEDLAKQLDLLSKSFSPVMGPNRMRSPWNHGFQFSIGNQTRLFGRPLGYLGSLNYSRNYTYYENGTTARWQLTGHVDRTETLNNDFNLTDSKGKDEVSWGGLTNLSYMLHSAHELGLNVMYNRSGESSARYQSGPFPRDLSQDGIYETRTLQYKERSLASLQLRGKHLFENLGKLKVEWISSFTRSTQDEPDLRFFTNDYIDVVRNGTTERQYYISQSLYPRPNRYFRNTNEDNWDTKFDAILPVSLWNDLNSQIKFGAAYTRIDHLFRERRFEFRQGSKLKYDGDLENFFSEENMGILEEVSTDSRYQFGNYLVDLYNPANNYDGDQRIGAVYLMTRLVLSPSWEFIGGARFETTRLHVVSHDEELDDGNLDNKDLLPSASFVFHATKNVNLRAAYGRTLARPTFRELAPYASYEFVNDYMFIGNENLKRTLSDNFDLRWEWFPRIGEIVAVSAFYKHLHQPIEKVIRTINGETQFQNVDEAICYGAEFEFRKNLDQLGGFMRYFQAGANIALIKSQVDIAESELTIIQSVNPYHSGKRELQGQSPFVVNLDLAYDNEGWGTSIGLDYNVFGKRIALVSLGGTPDVYEMPFHMLNFSFNQVLVDGLKLKITAKNLLDQKVSKVHLYKDTEYPVYQYKVGRVFSIGLNYSI
jgi:TonB-dependent receptor